MTQPNLFINKNTMKQHNLHKDELNCTEKILQYKLIYKIIYFIIYIILHILYSNTITLGSYLIGQNRNGGNITKRYVYWIQNTIYQKGFSPIYYTGKYEPTNKIDIIIITCR